MRRYLYLVLLFLSNITCRERYDVEYTMPDSGLLVVEGFINTDGATTITLSKTTKLTERRIVPEISAVVSIEGEDNSFYPLNETDSGRYVSEALQLNNSGRYRLRIKTQSNKEYVSPLAQPVRTPAIDSLTWKQDNEGLDIYVNAYEPQNPARHYKWEYEETWEFRAHYYASLGLRVEPSGGPNPLLSLYFLDSTTFSFDSSMFFCWQSRNSTSIVLATTEKLSENRVFVPLLSYPRSSPEFAWLYSVKVKQRALSPECYLFYEKMRKNTETVGSIFDALPSDIKGNIENISDPSEPVIGFVDVSTQTEKRLFISADELSDWYVDSNCLSPEVVGNTPEALNKLLLNGMLPTTVHKSDYNGNIQSFNAAARECVDCRLKGSPVKPSFWPW